MLSLFIFLTQNRKVQGGFTLMELLLGALLSSLVLSAMGFGLAAMMQADVKSTNHTYQRITVSRAIDFMSEDIRMAKIATTTAPSWASWSLGSGGSPVAKLYLQVPATVQNMTAADDYINLPNHGLNNSNAVMFTGPSGSIAGGLTTDTVYYVVDSEQNRFRVASTVGGLAIDLTSDATDQFVAEKLIIYYLRDSTATWLSPKTINRSLGPCSVATNCPVLIDSIKNNGLSITTVNAAEVTLTLEAETSGIAPTTTSMTSKSAVRANQLPPN